MNEEEKSSADDAYYEAARAWFEKVETKPFKSKKVDMRYFIRHPPFIMESELSEGMLESKSFGSIYEVNSPGGSVVSEDTEY